MSTSFGKVLDSSALFMRPYTAEVPGFEADMTALELMGAAQAIAKAILGGVEPNLLIR